MWRGAPALTRGTRGAVRRHGVPVAGSVTRASVLLFSAVLRQGLGGPGGVVQAPFRGARGALRGGELRAGAPGAAHPPVPLGGGAVEVRPELLDRGGEPLLLRGAGRGPIPRRGELGGGLLGLGAGGVQEP